MKAWPRQLALIVMASAAWSAHAANGLPGLTTTTPVVRFDADAYPGSQYREQLAQATAASDTKSILQQVQPILAYCEARTAERGVHVSVATKEEERAFAASQPPGTVVDYVDAVCPRADFAAASASIDLGDSTRAADYLGRAQALAPYWAEPYTERGFLYNAQGDRQHALASYRHALELAKTWPSSRYVTAMALRGIGWTLVELGDYAGGKQSYRDSLAVEPGNALAENELAFIAQNEGKGTPQTPALDTALPQDEKSVALREFVADTKRLELSPLADDAPETRQRLIKWMTESPDVTVVACDVFDLGGGREHFERELFVQYAFGNAAFQIEHPGQKDDIVAVQLAGVKSALRAYRKAVAERAQLRTESMDALLRHEDAGDLKAALEPRIKAQCHAPEGHRPEPASTSKGR